MTRAVAVEDCLQGRVFALSHEGSLLHVSDLAQLSSVSATLLLQLLLLLAEHLFLAAGQSREATLSLPLQHFALHCRQLGLQLPSACIPYAGLGTGEGGEQQRAGGG